MTEKAKNKIYKHPEEFLVDVKWIVHNWTILFAGKNNLIGKVRKQFIQMFHCFISLDCSANIRQVQELLNACKAQLSHLKYCPECYWNLNENPKMGFTYVCAQPHLLVWAKFDKYPLWPAKVMSVKDDGIEVQFFGSDHPRSTVSANKCFLHSGVLSPSPAIEKSFPAIIEAISVCFIAFMYCFLKFEPEFEYFPFSRFLKIAGIEYTYP